MNKWKLGLRLFWREWSERVIMAIVWKLPRRFVSWAAIRVVADYSTSDAAVATEVPEICAMDAIGWWMKPHGFRDG
jgi:hypothetical protein